MPELIYFPHQSQALAELAVCDQLSLERAWLVLMIHVNSIPKAFHSPILGYCGTTLTAPVKRSMCSIRGDSFFIIEGPCQKEIMKNKSAWGEGGGSDPGQRPTVGLIL
jgi:hypothetical protein